MVSVDGFGDFASAAWGVGRARASSTGSEGIRWDRPDRFDASQLRSYLDADGYLYFAGRSGDWIRVGGENVSALATERILRRHPRGSGTANTLAAMMRGWRQ